MKNIKITVLKNKRQIHEYTADLVPIVGDLLEVPATTSTKNSLGLTSSTDNPGSGTYIVTDRIFVGNNNQVKLLVDDLIEQL